MYVHWNGTFRIMQKMQKKSISPFSWISREISPLSWGIFISLLILKLNFEAFSFTFDSQKDQIFIPLFTSQKKWKIFIFPFSLLKNSIFTLAGHWLSVHLINWSSANLLICSASSSDHLNICSSSQHQQCWFSISIWSTAHLLICSSVHLLIISIGISISFSISSFSSAHLLISSIISINISSSSIIRVSIFSTNLWEINLRHTKKQVQNTFDCICDKVLMVRNTKYFTVSAASWCWCVGFLISGLSCGQLKYLLQSNRGGRGSQLTAHSLC